METPKAAAALLYKFAIRSTIGDNYPPKCTHYLPLFIVDSSGHPKPVIANLDDTAFVVNNEFGVKTQHDCGGVHAYVSPQHHDLCPEESAYYPRGSKVKAIVFNQNWIQIQGKEDVPADIKIKQVAQFAHAIPYWQQCGQQLQLARAAEDAAQPRAQLAIQDGSPRSQTPVLVDLPVQGAPLMLAPGVSHAPASSSTAAPFRGPDGFATQVVATSARSEPVTTTTESYIIATPRNSPPQPHTGRSMISLPWRSASCSRRAPTRYSYTSTPGATDVAAQRPPDQNAVPLHRFTFGGREPRPAPDLPPLPMGFVKGFVVDDQDKNRDAAFRQDAILDARDESLRKDRELLQMEK